MSKDILGSAKNVITTVKPTIFCVCRLEFKDIKPTVEICAAFFDESDAEKARDWLQQNNPVPLSAGWIEIIPTTLTKIGE